MSRFDEIYPVFPEYDMFAQTIQMLKEPNVYKVMTPFGSFVCKRTEASHGRLRFVTGVLRHLQHRGWDGALPIVYSKYDEPFVVREQSTYYLTPWQPPSPLEQAGVEGWAVSAMERLAELHQLTQNYRYDDPRQVEPLVDTLLQKWRAWLDLMERHQAYAKSLSYPSPFDVVFLANYAFIREMADTAVQSLADWRERHQTYAHFRLSLIHGYPHPSHTLIDASGKVRLINFDRAVFDTPVRDLAMFYRSYFYSMGDDVTASAVYRKYAAIFPLRPDEIDLLSAFLLYPERVIRDIEAYYGRKKDWNELTAVRRLEKDLDRFIRLCRWTQRAF